MSHPREIIKIVPYQEPSLVFRLGKFYLTADNRVVSCVGSAADHQFPYLFRFEDTCQLFKISRSGVSPDGIEVVTEYP